MAKPVKGAVVEIETKEDFDAFLKAAGSTLVVIDFFADWCGPCKRIKPIFAKFAAEEFKEKAYFAKINVDENTDTAEAQEISAMPTFKLYKNGENVDVVTGANDAKLREMIQKYTSG